jgi:hypothetical protein
MSGKSTLLRTIGVNVALALAGAPVRARHLRVSPMNMGATLRIQDSLQTGTSRFYAEIRRLRQIVDLRLPVAAGCGAEEQRFGINAHRRAECVGRIQRTRAKATRLHAHRSVSSVMFSLAGKLRPACSRVL